MKKSAMLEIERRFLARVRAGTRLPAPARLRQGYLSAGQPSVRIRDRDGKWRLAFKSGTGPVRREIELPVEPDVGEALLGLAGSRVLAKRRHDVGRWEIDCFEGALEGLVVAEIELEREDEALPPPPEGVTLLREVTDELTSGWLASLPEERARETVRELYGSAP